MTNKLDLFISMEHLETDEWNQKILLTVVGTWIFYRNILLVALLCTMCLSLCIYHKIQIHANSAILNCNAVLQEQW